MLKEVQAFVKEYNMIQKGDGIVLGVSGGADSVCLFHIMLEMRKVYQLKLVVVHVNHLIRGDDAYRDEEYVGKLCKKNDIDFISVQRKVKDIARDSRMSEEEAGRMVRYQAFESALQKYGCQKIAVAHNKNDLCETVMFHLIRGSGLKGMVGIEPIRGNIIRPLLCMERNKIEEYLGKWNIIYQDDVTNHQEQYTRNKIRHNVLSYIKENINEQVIAHISGTAEMLSEVNEYIEEKAGAFFKQSVDKNDKEYYISIQRFEEQHPVIQKSVLRKIMFTLAGRQKDIERVHVDSILANISRGVGKKVDLPYGLECQNNYDKLVIRKKAQNKIRSRKIKFKVAVPGTYKIDDFGRDAVFRILNMDEENKHLIEKMCTNPKNNYTKVFDYDKIKNAIFLRTREQGDFFQCSKEGGHKKLKEFFVNEKVPADMRERMLLLADGCHIMWIVGFRISEFYKVSKSTKKILYVEIDGGNE